jgi:hypothetical protein
VASLVAEATHGRDLRSGRHHACSVRGTSRVECAANPKKFASDCVAPNGGCSS